MKLDVMLKPPWRQVQAVLTLVGISGIVLLFLPFTWSTSPIEVFLEREVTSPIWLLATPCIVLPFLISAGYALLLITGHLARWMVVTSLAFAALFVVVSLAGMTREGPDETGLFLWVIVAFASGGWLISRGVSRDSAIRGLVAMQCVYVILMAFWINVAGPPRDFESGTWLGVVTLITYLGQIALAAKRLSWLLALAIPVAGIFFLQV